MTKEKKTITILGEELTIRFNMKVEITFEEITGEAFSLQSLEKQKNCIALYYAAILTNNPDTNIKIEQLLEDATAKEINNLAEAVIGAMTEWMKIPSVLPKEDQQAEDSDKASDDESPN